MLGLYVRLMSLLPGRPEDSERPDQEEGQGLAEYALILVLIAIVCFIALEILGTTVSTVLSSISVDL